MSLDFLQVREQIKRLGENAPQRAQRLQTLRQRARQQLKNSANDLERLHQKVRLAASNYDPNLRCALPSPGPNGELEALDSCFPLPSVPAQATILAADGSQITPDRHAPVNYCLINVGAIQMQLGAANAPEISIASQLLYDEELYTPSGMITDARLALMRDLNERKQLARLAQCASAPVITFTDGPMELWGAKDNDNDSEFQKSLDEYLQVLSNLQALNVITAGYVDKPAANLVVRLLEVAMLDENELPNIRKQYPLRGVIDKDLFLELLDPGDRSAIFAIQSRSAQHYKDALGLHFFYLNVGRQDHPWLARVELPGWVAHNQEMLDQLHAVLVYQCRIMGNRPYPYLLHRAHEAAVVSMEEKAQVTQMISLELRNRGVEVGEISNKQAAKELKGRTKFER